MNSIAWLLSKLRFPLAVNLGGTGKDTTEGLLTDLKTAGAYAKNNILGTVSQTAGIPTGAVIERGTNGNGEYVKYADGTLICTFSRTRSVAVSSAYGALFYNGSTVGSGDFPAAFTAIPWVGITIDSSGGCWSALISGPTTANWGSYYILSGVSRAASTIVERYLAIGRWY